GGYGLLRGASAVQHPRGHRHARRREHRTPDPAAGRRSHMDAGRHRNHLHDPRRSAGHPFTRHEPAISRVSVPHEGGGGMTAQPATLGSATVRSHGRPFLGLGTVMRKELTEWVRGPKALIILGVSVLAAVFTTLVPFIAAATK